MLTEGLKNVDLGPWAWAVSAAGPTSVSNEATSATTQTKLPTNDFLGRCFSITLDLASGGGKQHQAVSPYLRNLHFSLQEIYILTYFGWVVGCLRWGAQGVVFLPVNSLAWLGFCMRGPGLWVGLVLG